MTQVAPAATAAPSIVKRRTRHCSGGDHFHTDDGGDAATDCSQASSDEEISQRAQAVTVLPAEVRAVEAAQAAADDEKNAKDSNLAPS